MNTEAKLFFINPKDELTVAEICLVYKSAFAGPPWHEELSLSETRSRINRDFARPGFTGMLLQLDGNVVAASWHDTVSVQQLENERGASLADYVVQNFDDWLVSRIIWNRDTIVSTKYQNLGLGERIKIAIDKHIASQAMLCQGLLVLTRMREDNIRIMHINHRLGYNPTDITVPSSQVPGLNHRYWFKYYKGGIHE